MKKKLRKDIKPTVINTPNLNPLRFSGKRVRQSSAKLAQMEKRDKRLRKIGHTVMDFNS